MPKSRSSYGAVITVLVIGIILSVLSYSTYSQSQPQGDCSEERWSCVMTQDVLLDRKGCPVRLSSEKMMKYVADKIPISPPALLGNNNLRGVVKLEVVVDKKGEVKCARGVDGHPMARNMAVQAVSKWKFRPYKVDGKCVAILGYLNIPYDFSRIAILKSKNLPN